MSGSSGPEGLSPEKRALFSLLLGRDGLDTQEADRVHRRLDGDAPASFAQQRLWLAEQLVPGSPAYNVAAVVRLDGVLDLDVLDRAVFEIVRRHEVLRTSFITRDGEP